MALTARPGRPKDPDFRRDDERGRDPDFRRDDEQAALCVGMASKERSHLLIDDKPLSHYVEMMKDRVPTGDELGDDEQAQVLICLL